MVHPRNKSLDFQTEIVYIFYNSGLPVEYLEKKELLKLLKKN